MTARELPLVVEVYLVYCSFYIELFAFPLVKFDFLLYPLMLFINSVSSITAIQIVRELSSLAGLIKVELHQIRYIFGVPRFPVQFDPVELFSGSKWWWININDFNVGCWTVSLKRVFLVGRLLGDFLC